MKLYYFMLIAIGLMWTLHLAGVPTETSNILNSFQFNNINNLSVNPTVSDNPVASDIKSAPSFWWAILLFFGVVALLAFIGGIEIFGTSFNPSIDGAVAVLASFIWAVFAIDYITLLKYMYALTGGTGWEWNITFILIGLILVGFAISLLNFVRGTE